MAKQNLSPASIYERTFKTRQRSVGRPADAEPVFAPVDVDPVIRTIAQRRAYAVVHEENKGRLAEVFIAEVGVLRRRGAEQAAKDAGIDLSKRDKKKETV